MVRGLKGKRRVFGMDQEGKLSEKLHRGETRFVVELFERRLGGEGMKHRQIGWEESSEYFTPTSYHSVKDGVGIVDMEEAKRRGKKRCAGGSYISSAPDDPVGPEKALLCAVIERAVRDLFDRNSEVQSEARAWFLRPGLKSDGFSFAWVCEELGYDQAWFVKKLTPYITGDKPLEDGGLAEMLACWE